MNKYIDADKLTAELSGFRNIARERIDNEDNYFLGMAQGYDNSIDIINSLQQEQPQIIDHICSRAGIPIPYMDGNQWCILKGDNIQCGVVGFGDTKEDAIVDFIKNIPLQQEQPEKYETALEKAREWMPNVNQGGHAILIEIFPELGEGLDPRYGGRKQEQSEADLEKELKNERTKLLDAFGPMNGEQCLAIRNFARHFYGLRNRVLEEAARHVYESWMGGTMGDVIRDMVELGKVLNARKED